MSEPKKSTYEPVPEVPEELREKVRSILDVMAGKLTEVEAAKQLGLSRHYFQTLKNRGLKALICELEPKPMGRPAKPTRETELEQELERLRKENARLQKRVNNVDQLLEVAADVMKGRLVATGRQNGSQKSTVSNPAKSDVGEEPDGARGALLRVRKLVALGVPMELASALVGLSCPTVRRYQHRERLGEELRRRRGPSSRPPPAAELNQAARTVVRQMRGVIGAAALSRAVPGLSRRQAAVLKAKELTAMESDRIGEATRVRVEMPNVIRGFDAMHVGDHYLLVAADASLPYRTLIEAVER